MHPALKSELYRKAYSLFKQNKTFTLVDIHNEHKTFVPNTLGCEYNIQWLRNYFKIAHDLDAPIVAVI